MKLAPLLAQYLYIHKRLDLPGLGTFLLDSAVVIDQETNKQSKSPVIEGVTFEKNIATKESPDLIQFISSQSGKIKALASADLDSHLSLAQQFINIGKPFLFEGIGSLSKIGAGEYTFTPGHVLAEKFTDQQTKDSSNTHSTEEQDNDYKSVFYAPKAKMKWAKPVTILLILVGLGLAILGGYTVYKRTAATEEVAAAAPDTTVVENNNNAGETIILPDSVTAPKKDSLVSVVQNIPAGTTKFVLETAIAARAFPRFKRLKEFQWNVLMETTDSVSYKLYMLLPVVAADTTRVIDSLSKLNGRRVYIEN